MPICNTIYGEPVFQMNVLPGNSEYILTGREELSCKCTYKIIIDKDSSLGWHLHKTVYGTYKMVILVPGDKKVRSLIADIPYVAADSWSINISALGNYSIEFTVPRGLDITGPIQFTFMSEYKLTARTRFRSNKMPLFYDEIYEKCTTGFSQKIYSDLVNSIMLKPTIKKVIFNNPATIVFWEDGTKTVVKAGDGDIYDPEKGLAMAFAKKFLGNKGNFNEVFKKYLKEYHERELEKEAAKKVTKKKTTRKKTVKKSK